MSFFYQSQALYLCLILSLLSCNQTGKSTILLNDTAIDSGNPSIDENAPIDQDGDGFSQEEDCNDQNPNIFPQATEICNGIDDNCDGNIDEETILDWYFDFDGDGYGGDFLESACTSIETAVLQTGDCDDSNPLIFPNNTEKIDGIDSNCDGAIDWLVTIYVAVDDAGELCLNDQVIGDTGGWNIGKKYEHWMTSGPVAVGIYGWDLGMHITAGIAHIEISNGSVWTTDSSWLYSPNPDETTGKAGWCTPPFDDSTWQAVQVIGPIGTSPWGNAPSIFPSGSSAHWIWDHYPVALNSQYLRKVIALP